MAKTYITVAGTGFRHGSEFMKKGMQVKLIKEPDNEYDKEAIKVLVKGLGHVGYVANSPYTVKGDSWSAGRIYDKIGDTARGEVVHIFGSGAICVLKKKDLCPLKSAGDDTDEQSV